MWWQSLPVSVVSDDDASLIVTNLSITVLFREVQAEQPGTVLIGGGVLPWGGGADNVVAHWFVSLDSLRIHDPEGSGGFGGQFPDCHTSGNSI